MINVDTRPDLISLLIELNHYNCMSIAENQILIEIPQFSKKTIDPWYGLCLVCKPNRTSIEVYVCRNKDNPKADAFINRFDTITTLEDLINQSIEHITTCDHCNKLDDLNNMSIHNNKILCLECSNNIRSKH